MSAGTSRDAVDRLLRAADLCDHARVLVDAGSDELAATLDQAAAVILSIDPVAIPAGTMARAEVDAAARRAVAAHTALSSAIAEEMQRVGRELGRLSSGSAATSQYARQATVAATIGTPRVSRLG